MIGIEGVGPGGQTFDSGGGQGIQMLGGALAVGIPTGGHLAGSFQGLEGFVDPRGMRTGAGAGEDRLDPFGQGIAVEAFFGENGQDGRLDELLQRSPLTGA